MLTLAAIVARLMEVGAYNEGRLALSAAVTNNRLMSTTATATSAPMPTAALPTAKNMTQRHDQNSANSRRIIRMLSAAPNDGSGNSSSSSSSGVSGDDASNSGNSSSDESDISTSSSSSSFSSSASSSKKQAKPAPQLKVYTKKGDKGTSALFTGERRKKTDSVFEALGAIDELSTDIGIAISLVSEATPASPKVGYMKSQLIDVQCMLQDVASYVATPKSSASNAHATRVAIPEEYVTQLEEWIDTITEDLTPLKNFILPGGGKLSSQIHKSRTLCRRAERAVVHALEHEHDLDCPAMRFVNRLSDYLFTLARSAAKEMGDDEIIYKKARVKRS